MFVQTGLLLVALLGYSRGDTFTSITEMGKLYDLEQYLAKVLGNYIKHADFETKLIEMHYKQFSRIGREIKDIEEYVENPINAYALIKRMHYDWPVTFKLMSSSPFLDEQPTEFPDKSAVAEAIARIVEWQTEENLDTSQLARGLYPGVSPHALLSASDCLEIAKYCYKTNMELAIEWLEQAHTKLEEAGGGASQLRDQVLEYMFLAQCLTDPKAGAEFANHLIVELVWYNPSPELKHEYNRDQVKKCKAAATAREEKDNPKRVAANKDSALKLAAYYAEQNLCHSERRSIKPEDNECYIDIQWASAQFLKLETFEQPNIQIIHDYLPEGLIVDIKLASLEKFKQLKTKGLNGPVHFPKNDPSVVGIHERLDKRITSLGIPSKMIAGDRQVYLHGPGDKQRLSLTELMQNERVPKNKIGTVYYFLNDVAKGGHIIFPSEHLSIEPSKGSLVLWHHNNKEVEVKECPVVVGSKWAMTQTIING